MTSNSENLSLNDFGKICRTCLREGEMRFLYQNCLQDDCLLEILMTVTLVQFTENDGLPVQICSNCENEAKKAYYFAQKCLESDKKLKNCLKEFQTELATNIETTNCQIEEINPKQERDFEIVIKSETQDENNYESSDNDSEKVSTTPKKQKIKKFGPPYVCKKCFEVFPTFKNLKQHWIEVKHPSDSRTTCKTCNKSIHWSRLGQHMRTHSSEQAFECDICKKRFNIKANLKRHQMIHSGEKPHQCQYCDKAFIQSFHLNVHLRTHTGETPFKCDQCEKRFASKGNLRLHSRVHLDITSIPTSSRFECEICKRNFKSKEILNSHKIIHGEKKFLCSECGRSFYSKAALLSHSYLHTGLKPLTCNTCHKKFRHLSTLNVHKLLHTGDKPYTCNVCNRKFTQRHHLTYHLRTHSGEKPYSCTFCDKSFALNNNLKVHIRTHTGETPYLCPICGKGFYDSSSMKKHKLGHGKQSKIKK